MNVKEYSELYNISVQAVYQKIKNGSIKAKKTNDGFKIIQADFNINIEYAKLETANKFLKSELESALKEIENYKYQIKDKDLKINQLLGKMENLNDRVIGLIEWKNKSWWQRIFNKK